MWLARSSPAQEYSNLVDPHVSPSDEFVSENLFEDTEEDISSWLSLEDLFFPKKLFGKKFITHDQWDRQLRGKISKHFSDYFFKVKFMRTAIFCIFRLKTNISF